MRMIIESQIHCSRRSTKKRTVLGKFVVISKKMSKHILLLGSGLMAESVADYLLKRPENSITIASNIIADAENIAKKKSRCNSAFVDVTDTSQVKLLFHADSLGSNSFFQGGTSEGTDVVFVRVADT